MQEAIIYWLLALIFFQWWLFWIQSRSVKKLRKALEIVRHNLFVKEHEASAYKTEWILAQKAYEAANRRAESASIYNRNMTRKPV